MASPLVESLLAQPFDADERGILTRWAEKVVDGLGLRSTPDKEQHARTILRYEAALRSPSAPARGEEEAEPHCPECHSAWFRTLGRTVGVPFNQWVRECNLCGHEYKTTEALMLVQVGIGEPDAPTTPPSAPDA
jgi:hypothetical protein